ncbi:MAG: rhomboid family intramembrane serine protease [Armatimonadetes bacterium]|jgi:membrane associated rhomboid family serine protease|nr:rhomboid family intramembrane serine protease [Armatimonadota bacterium]
MLPIRDDRAHRTIPYVTWALLGLNLLLFLWDRQGRVFGPNLIFSDLAMRPSEVVGAIKGPDRFAIVTIFTSMFLHGSLLHLFGNGVFLMVFGPSVEAAMGSWRFALYYLGWGIFAAMTHTFVDPHSIVPTIGASGAIGGVLGAYFLLFPSSKIEIVIPILAFLSFEVAAYIVLGLWFAYQIFIPQEGVANWAHAGGFLAGMITVLLMGGRAVILLGREQEFEDDDDA